MAWNEEIKDAVYTSPSGREFVFHYGDLKSDTDLKTATFTFPEKDGALVVPLGVGGRRFPMSCFFYGADCFSLADDFEEGLKERGYGELQHPIYGNHKVVPTGQISRSDNLVSGLNVSVVEVVFSETIIDETFPQSKILGEDLIRGKVSVAFENIAGEVTKDLEFSSVSEKINAQGVQKSLYKIVCEKVENVIKVSKSAYTEYQTVAAETEKYINSFSQNTSFAVLGVMKILQLAADVTVKPVEKIEAFGGIISEITTAFKNNPAGKNNRKNQFVLTKAVLEGAESALSSGVSVSSTGGVAEEDKNESAASSVKKQGVTFINHTNKNQSVESAFRSRDDAVNSATSIAELYDHVLSYIDERTGTDLIIDTGEGFNSMRDIVSDSLAFIIDRSFSLSSRKTIILDRDRQIMELLSELYGNFDNLDEFIIDNDLTIDEIGLLPMGREVSYYV